MKKRNMILSIVVVGILSGCSSKNNQFDVTVKNSLKEVKKANNKLDKVVKAQEKITENKYLDFSIHKRLSTLLEELSTMDKQVYHLEGKDITYPIFNNKDSKTMNINNIDKLVTFTPTVTNYAINIKPVFGGKINIVKIVDKYQKDSNLLNVKLKVNGKVPLNYIMKKISNLTGFNVLFTLNNKSSNSKGREGEEIPAPNNFNNKTNNSELALIKDKKVYFKGSNIKEFFDYVSQLFDVYIDVDYLKKLIKITKYKTKIYNVLPLIAAQVDSGVVMPSTQLNSQSGNTPQGITARMPISSGYNENKISALLGALKQLIQQNGGTLINVSDGLVSIKSTKQGFKKINKVVDKFNSKYSKIVDITITTYQFLVSKDFNLGLDLKYITDKFNITTSNLTNVLGKYTSKTGNTVGLGMSSSNVKFLKKYSYEGNFLNGIQTLINTTSSKDYLKSLKTETTTNTATTVSTKTPEIGKINQGETFGVTPNIYGDKVLINATLKLNVLNNLLKQKLSEDGDYITLPDVSTQSIPINTLIKVGDRMIVGIYQLYQKSSNYKGIIPNDNFLIGGSKDNAYVKQLFIVTAEVKRVIE